MVLTLKQIRRQAVIENHRSNLVIYLISAIWEYEKSSEFGDIHYQMAHTFMEIARAMRRHIRACGEDDK